MSDSTGAGTGLISRLYRGDANFGFIASRKKWYLASAIIIVICILSMATRGFNVGIDFKGGNSYSLPATSSSVSLADIRTAVESQGVSVESAQTAGSGSARTFQVKTPSKANDQATVEKVVASLAKAGHVAPKDVTTSNVSESWGSDVTNQALLALVVFLVAVGAFIWLRFQEWRMATAALGALLHDLLLTAGVYSIIGFEVTPSTVVGLLTILGYSLYDTVVVFDKVSENSKGLLSSSRFTYPEAANNAVNQTLMRSINTSIIGLLPVAGLLFVGAGILGVGTLEDLALVLFVGMLTGAYSSLFLATPWLVDLKLTDPRYKAHEARVLARRESQRKEAAEKRAAVEASGEVGDEDEHDTEAYVATVAPRVGAKPQPAGKRGPGPRPAATNRPGAKRR
jgi:preprotein translocase subunit SecF